MDAWIFIYIYWKYILHWVSSIINIQRYVYLHLFFNVWHAINMRVKYAGFAIFFRYYVSHAMLNLGFFP